MAKAAQAATIPAASCSQADVQAAINSAGLGDTIAVPAGTCTYTTQLTAAKGIVLQGAGQGVTNIILSGSDFIQFSPYTTTGVIRITGFSLSGANAATAIMIQGTPTSYRVDHITATNLAHRFVWIGEQNDTPPTCYALSGLVDHVAWTQNNNIPALMFTGCNEAWSGPTTLGTAGANYVEDSTFTYTGSGFSSSVSAMDCEHGCKFVFRHNTVVNNWVAAHDTGSTGQARSTRQYEVYANAFSCTSSDGSCYGWANFRGGTGVMFDNSAAMDAGNGKTGFANGIVTEIYRVSYGTAGEPWNFGAGTEAHRVCAFPFQSIRLYCSSGNPDASVCYSVGASCDGGKGTCKDSCTQDADCAIQPPGQSGKCLTRFDGAGISGAPGYPVRDQTGTSADGPDGAKTQTLDPSYVWNNTNSKNGNALITNVVAVNGADTNYIVANRDFYAQGSSFDGTTGIGRGALSFRPTTCTAGAGGTPGVGYFATDTNTFYKCVATNTWAASYIPYSYPHPLQGIGGGGGTQPWTGILDPARAMDWTQAGIPGGIPSRTSVCANVLTTDNTAAIQGKIDACPQDQVVLFPAGTWNLTASLHVNDKGIVLRGAGPTLTTINLGSGTNILFSPQDAQSGQGSYANGPYYAVNWTGGLTKGSTVLTVGSTANLSAGQMIQLDQHDDTRYVSACGAPGTGGGCPLGSRNDSPSFDPTTDLHQQAQKTTITAVCMGNGVPVAACTAASQIVVDPPVDFTATASLSPQVFWWNPGAVGGYKDNLHYAAVENLKINANKNERAIMFDYCSYCWAKNVEVGNVGRGAIMFFYGYRGEVRDSYIWQAPAIAGPTQYGFEIFNSSLIKLENNIIFNETSPVLPASDDGLVVGYNYMHHIYGPDNQFSAIEPHQVHNFNHLYEGNVLYMVGYDSVWGSSSHNTMFRNFSNGKEPNKINYRIPIIVRALNKYINIVGNVLGTAGYHTQYVCDRNHLQSTDNYVYDLGFGDGCPTVDASYDDVAVSSLMRWGNWDVVTYAANGNTNGVRWCTGAGAGNPACTASETASADPTFPGLANPSTTLPASFYLPAKPSWFNNVNGTTNVAWPPIGPDVACAANCNANTANHAAKIPAQLCYENSAKDGNGYLTAFDANACYKSGGGDVTPPTVGVSAPANGSTVSGTITVSGTAADNVSVSNVAVSIDGGAYSSAAGTTSWAFVLDTTALSNAAHTIAAKATDSSGNTAAASISVTVNNGGGGSSPWSGILDPNRAADWSQAGIPGGIPSAGWAQCGATLQASAYGNGASDATAAIQAALNGCAGSHYVSLSSGTFRINSQLTIPSNVALRGGGPDKTRLDMHGSGVFGLLIGASVSPSAFTAITGGATKGSTSVTVASAAGISVGKMLVVTQTDTSYMTEQGSGGLCNWCNSGIPGMGDSGQMVLVTTVTGTTVGFSPGLYMDYSPNSPNAFPVPVGATRAGIEDLQVYANDTGYGTNILLDGAVNCWVKNVEGNFADGDHVDVWYSLGNVIRDSYFHDGYIHHGGQTDDMINLAYKTTASLVENNILWRLHSSFMTEWGGMGNVFAYNYSDGNYHQSGPGDYGSWFIEDIAFGHGAHPMLNLFEGNIGGKFEQDTLWGSTSHGTSFRNWWRGSRQYVPPPDARGALQPGSAVYEDLNNQGVSIGYLSQYTNLVADVVGSDHFVNADAAVNMRVSPASGGAACYRIGYNDDGSAGPSPNNAYNTLFMHGVNNCVDGSILWSTGITHALPASFYLPGKPSWWGPAPWPANGPDVSGGSGWQGHANLNPAAVCFNSVTANGTSNTGAFNANNCYGSGGGGDTTPPVVSISTPADRSNVSGTVTLSANASDNVGVVRVDFYADGTKFATVKSPPYSATWNAANKRNGSAHTLAVVATDAAGNQTSASVSVTVSNALSANATVPGLRQAYVYPSPAARGQDPVIRALLGWADGVEVSIYDISGHLVNSAKLDGTPTGIMNGEYYYDYPWTGAKSSGVYFAVIHGKSSDGTIVRARVRFAVVR